MKKTGLAVGAFVALGLGASPLQAQTFPTMVPDACGGALWPPLGYTTAAVACGGDEHSNLDRGRSSPPLSDEHDPYDGIPDIASVLERCRRHS